MRHHYVMDFLALFFCHWCALVQEFKFMERVFEVKRNGERGVEICPRIPVASPVGETLSACVIVIISVISSLL